MKIDDIKDPQIRALAWKYRKANKGEYLNEDTVDVGFDWYSTEEGADFWDDVNYGNPVEITEKMKADHPEIFKQEEKMKTKHELKNGTVLEVGKKYYIDYLNNKCVYEVKYLGEKCTVLNNQDNNEKVFFYSSCIPLIPYEEPKEKVKPTKFYCSAYDDKFYNDEFIIIFLSSKEIAKEL